MDVLPTPSTPSDDVPVTADERERLADLREAALDKRESAVEVVESAVLLRDHKNQAVLEAADDRDERAEERDVAADARDRAASLDSFLGDADYSPGHKSRLSAGLDRQDSKGDRTSAADDRGNLTRDDRECSELDDV